MSNGIPVTVERAAEELRKYRRGLKVMSGGFTLSGGEPLMQHRFAVKLFRAAQAMGIHTAVETNGYYGDKLSDADLEAIDLVLLDIKMWDAERHRRLTGMVPDQTRAFAKRLAANGRPMWVRFVLVPQLTDDADNISRIASFTASLGNVQRVDAAVPSARPFNGRTSGFLSAGTIPSHQPWRPSSKPFACSGQRD